MTQSGAPQPQTAQGSMEPADDQLLLTFIGAGTALLRYAGFTVLTDPAFVHLGEQAPLGYGLHTVRQTEPSLDIPELPALDVVALSHYHGDHFDPAAERELSRDVPIVTTRHGATMLTLKGFKKAEGLPTWETRTFEKPTGRLRITALPGNHRPGLSWLFPPVMGTLMEFEHPSGRRLRIYHTGDTLMHGALAEIPRRCPEIDLMLPHVGGTRIGGLLLTMNGEQLVRLIRLVRPRLTIPIHFHDFHVYREPLGDLQAAIRGAGLESQVRYIRHGETQQVAVPPAATAGAGAGSSGSEGNDGTRRAA